MTASNTMAVISTIPVTCPRCASSDVGLFVNGSGLTTRLRECRSCRLIGTPVSFSAR